MSRGGRFADQRRRRRHRKESVRFARPGAFCIVLEDHTRAIATTGEIWGIGATANQAWWDAWWKVCPVSARCAAQWRRAPCDGL
jgi:hypothetical protein